MSENLEVHQARVGDRDIILGMIDEAAGWLRTIGTDQWNEPWPNRRARDNRVLRGLRSGRTWLVKSGSTAVATITCRQHGNQELWTEREQDEPAVYVSRLIVRRKYSGLGIGSSLIDWAALRATRAWNAKWIRIDVWTSNKKLQAYYEEQGFIFYRECPFDPKYYPSGFLFQKPTSELSQAAAARFIEPPMIISGRINMPPDALQSVAAERVGAAC